MSLRLIHSAKESSEPQHIPEPLNRMKLAIFVAVLFFVIKLPMCFVTNNPEELRDFDHYARSASGEYAYRDFVWVYGPLSPIVYGTVLKVLPHKLISVRLFSLLVWSVGIAFATLLISVYFQSLSACLWGALFVSGIVGYPSYSHNHVLAAVGAIACAYYLTKYLDRVDGVSLMLSFLGLATVFFTRPILSGYGMVAVWFALVYFKRPELSRFRALVVLAGTLVVGVSVFLLIYGRPVLWAFFPRPWAILESKGYPNLHYLIPKLRTQSTSDLLKGIWAALETAVFYLHYFIWPTLVFTLAFVLPRHRTFRGAALCCAFALAGSLDLLHYGFNDPMNEQAMWVRGQYFFCLTAISLFLVLAPVAVGGDKWMKRTAAKLVLAAVALWSYFPYALGVDHLDRFRFNEYSFPALSGILTHPDRRFVFEAIQFINSQCSSDDYVVVTQYDPGLGRLLKCHELFGRDAYLFARWSGFRLVPRETPYAPEGGVTNGEMINAVTKKFNPRFYLVQGNPEFGGVCSQPGWTVREFGTGANGRKVCYRALASK